MTHVPPMVGLLNARLAPDRPTSLREAKPRTGVVALHSGQTTTGIEFVLNARTDAFARAAPDGACPTHPVVRSVGADERVVGDVLGGAVPTCETQNRWTWAASRS